MKHIHLLKLTCLSVLFVGLTSAVQAAPKTPAVTGATPAAANATPGKDKSGKKAEKMKEKLGLSDDQLAKLLPIFQSERQELSALKENTALSKEDKKAQLKAIREKYKPQIAAILTPDQQAKMKEAREEHHERKNATMSATPAKAAS